MVIERETPSLAEVIRTAIEAQVTDLRVMLPGQVESYDSSTQKANIQPLLKTKFKDGEIQNLPVISNVPVMFQRSGKAFISLPLQKGDTGALIFCDRSLDVWLSKGGIVDPDDPRKHDLSDAAFYPGLYPFTDSVNADDINIVIENDQHRIDIKPDGKITIKNLTTGAELFNILSLTLQQLSIEPFITGKSVFAALKVQLDTLKG